MLALKFTPFRRFALAIVAIGYLFSSHYLIAGSVLLQFLTLFFGLCLTTLLITSIASASVDTSVRGLLQEFMDEHGIEPNT